MITSTHKQSVEISISLSFCILFVVLVGTASTAVLAYSSPEYGLSGGSSSSSNSTGDSTGGSSSSSNADGGLEDSGYKDPSSNSQSAESIAQNDATSDSSGSSGSSSSSGGSSSSSSTNNSTGTADEKLGSQDTNTGSDSNVGSRGGNDTNSGKSVIQRGMECDTSTHQSCSSLNTGIGKIPGNICTHRHGETFCTSYGTAGSSANDKNIQNNESSPNTNPSLGQTNLAGLTGLGTIREIAPGAPSGPHTLEYIQAFNTAAGNPYKPGTKQYQNYQAGLRAAKKAGRDCDKMDTCGGPDLLGNYVNGALHLSDKQYCGNGFGVYSSKLCKFREGCVATIMGTLECPSSESQLPGKLALSYQGK
jgi:hypothetical protein